MDKIHIIFLGAGASAAEGAPIQSALLQKMIDNELQYYHRLKGGGGFGGMTTSVPDIVDFLSFLFGVDRKNNTKPLPTFEEALGILDYAIGQAQGLGSYMYPSGSRVHQSGSLEQVRQMLVDELAKAVVGSGDRGVHKMLCAHLKAADLLDKTCFVTTNYDTYIDDGLASAVGPDNIDFGCAFDNQTVQSIGKQQPVLLHLHGSLRWQHCDNCGATENREFKHTQPCPRCGGHSFQYPLIVPPTYFKRLGYDAVASTWATFRRLLRRAKSVTFCGYSFPDADFHIKAELKRAENISRPGILASPDLRISVCNNYAGKSDGSKDAERLAYSRFMAVAVNYTALSFDEFANNPGSVLIP